MMTYISIGFLKRRRICNIIYINFFSFLGIVKFIYISKCRITCISCITGIFCWIIIILGTPTILTCIYFKYFSFSIFFFLWIFFIKIFTIIFIWMYTEITKSFIFYERSIIIFAIITNFLIEKIIIPIYI